MITRRVKKVLGRFCFSNPRIGCSNTPGIAKKYSKKTFYKKEVRWPVRSRNDKSKKYGSGGFSKEKKYIHQL